MRRGTKRERERREKRSPRFFFKKKRQEEREEEAKKTKGHYVNQVIMEELSVSQHAINQSMKKCRKKAKIPPTTPPL